MEWTLNTQMDLGVLFVWLKISWCFWITDTNQNVMFIPFGSNVKIIRNNTSQVNDNWYVEGQVKRFWHKNIRHKKVIIKDKKQIYVGKCWWSKNITITHSTPSHWISLTASVSLAIFALCSFFLLVHSFFIILRFQYDEWQPQILCNMCYSAPIVAGNGKINKIWRWFKIRNSNLSGW